jgi:hypothetical protein
MKTNLNLMLLTGSLLLLAPFCAPAARAQVSAPVTAAPNNPGVHQTLGSRDPEMERSRTIKGKIERLRAGDDALVIRDEKTGKLFDFSLDPKTKIRADKGTDLAGRKNLSLVDFREGQAVRLKYRPSDGKPLELRLRAVKS